MFSFHIVELLVVIVGGLALFAGIALLMLRRRNEILQEYLMPDEPELEEEFFRKLDPIAPTDTESNKNNSEIPKTDLQPNDPTVANEFSQDGWGNSAKDTANKKADENAENATNEKANENQDANPIP